MPEETYTAWELFCAAATIQRGDINGQAVAVVTINWQLVTLLIETWEIAEPECEIDLLVSLEEGLNTS